MKRPLLCSLLFAVGSLSCGGSDASVADDKTASTEAGSSSGGSKTESTGSAGRTAVADEGTAGLWINDKRKLLQVFDDGRYASFDFSSARQDLRPADPETNDDGELLFRAVHRTATWKPEGDALVGYVLRKNKSKEEAPVAVLEYRRLTPDEWTTYWEASAFRFVREGNLGEIVEAEAAGFDFSRLVDNAATMGEVQYHDMLGYAIEQNQRAVFDHYLERGFDLASSGAATEAMKRNDPELLAHVLDSGFPLKDVLRDGFGSYRDEIWTLIIERGYEFGEKVPVLGASHPVSGSLLVEKEIYTDRFFLSAVAAAGRTDLIDKVVSEHTMLAERPDILYQTGLVPAIAAGQIESVEKLLELGAPMDATYGGMNALTHAVVSQSPEMIDYVVEAGFDVNEPNPSRKTAIDIAIANDAPPSVFEKLFELGATPEAKHISTIKIQMRKNQEAVKALFEARL